jgi:hypothetical protein
MSDINEDWVELPDGIKISYGGISDDGALIINCIIPITLDYITVTFSADKIHKDLTS